MSLTRIWAVFLRYFYFFANCDTMSEVFYWPIIDILLWGLTSHWIQTAQTQIPDVALFILAGIVFWQVLWRAHYEVTVNLLQELWNRNLVNLFSTPLSLRDWMGATMLVGIAKISITLGFSSFLVWLLFKLNIFTVGWVMIPLMGLLLLSGWMMGFFTGAILAYRGQRLQMLAFMVPFAFAPFSAVTFPVSTLPVWGQAIAWCLPTTYIFEAMRDALAGNAVQSHLLWMSLVLNIIYLAGAFAFFKYLFEKSREKGLARLE